jgi:hypothetical protein
MATVTSEILTPNKVECTVNGILKIVAVSENGETLGDLFNAIAEEAGAGVNFFDASGRLADEAFVITEGQAAPPTNDPATVVEPGSRVVLDRKHANGTS